MYRLLVNQCAEANEISYYMYLSYCVCTKSKVIQAVQGVSDRNTAKAYYVANDMI